MLRELRETSSSDRRLTFARNKWTSSFGASLVAQLGGVFHVECGKAWRVGRYASDVDARHDEVCRISVFAMEDRDEDWPRGAADVTEFAYGFESDPLVAAETIALWLQSR
jgi:hypothetical protein